MIQNNYISNSNNLQEKFLSSVPQKLKIFQTLFLKALQYGDQAVENFMKNTFDAELHGKKEVKEYLNRIVRLTLAIRRYTLNMSRDKLKELNENLYRGTLNNEYDLMFFLLCDMLQFVGFLIEKRGDE